MPLRRQRAQHPGLFAAPLPGRQTADDGAAPDGHQGIAHEDPVEERRRKLLGEHDLDAFGAQRRDKALVLLVHTGHVGGSAPLQYQRPSGSTSCPSSGSYRPLVMASTRAPAVA